MPIDNVTSEELTEYLESSDIGKEVTESIRKSAREAVNANNHKLVDEKGRAEKQLKSAKAEIATLLARPPETVPGEVDESQLNKLVDEKLIQVTASHTAELETHKSTAANLTKHIVDSDLEAKLTSAIARAGGSPVLLMSHMKKRVKSEYDHETMSAVHRVVDEKGENIYTDKGNFDVDSLVNYYSELPDFQPAFNKSKPRGSGHTTKVETKKPDKVDKWGLPTKD